MFYVNKMVIFTLKTRLMFNSILIYVNNYKEYVLI